MASPGPRSLWGRPKRRSRRDGVDDDGSCFPNGAAKRASDPKTAADDIDDDKDDDCDKNKSKNDAASTSQESTTSQLPSTSTTIPAVAVTTPPSTTSSTSTTLLPTPTPAATTVWLTTSQWSTITSVQTTTALSALAPATPLPSTASTGLFRGESDDDDDDCSGCHDKGHGRPPPNNNKFAIAFGTLGGVGFLVGICWLVFFFYRWGKRRGRDTMSQYDNASTISKPKRFNFQWPFGRSNDGAGGARRPMSSTRGVSRRSNTSIMDEAMRGAYGDDNSSLHSVPRGYLDEKRRDPNYLLPVLDPAPIRQANLRKSIASWFRRSISNHPLKLNPSSRWSQSTPASSSFGGLTRITTDQRDTSYSVSIYSTSASNAPPPMPELDVQRAYADAAAATANAPVELPGSVPIAHTAAARGIDAPPTPYTGPITASRWSRSTGSALTAAGHDRMSSVSSRTDATQTTISGGRDSIPAMPQTALSPPGFHRPGGSKDLMTAMNERDKEELTSLREELLELYTQGARPDSAVGPKK